MNINEFINLRKAVEKRIIDICNIKQDVVQDLIFMIKPETDFGALNLINRNGIIYALDDDQFIIFTVPEKLFNEGTDHELFVWFSENEGNPEHIN